MQQRPARRYLDQTFLASFLLLNLLLFLPLYLLNWDDAALFPAAELLGWDWRTDLQHLLIWRKNVDPFRWNVELIVLVALWINIGRLRRPSVRWLLIALYFLTLFYYIYEAVTLSIYQVDPIFYHHYYLVLDGLQFLLEHLQLSLGLYLVSALLLLLALVAVYAFVQRLYSIPVADQLSPWLRIGFALFASVMLVVTVSYQKVLAVPTMVVSSLFYKIESNVERSLQVYRDVTTFDDTQLRQTYDYTAQPLRRKPNLYFIFIESYGSVLYQRPDYKASYEELLQALAQRFADNGWHTTTTLSESPTWGGGSWLAYTSTLFGLRIDTHPQFLALLNKYQAARYPNLGNYLKQQGYRYYHLSSLSSALPEGDWLKQERFFGVDHWFRFEELDYQGALYGWGPAPPDQYALYRTHEQLAQTNTQPFLLFFITQNSHYPFAPLPTLVEDWRTLNQASPSPQKLDAENIAHDQRRRNYANAITYELKMLSNFILQEGTADDLFILIGDHQPPRVSRRDDGFGTPVHIISRDAALVAAFQPYGFVAGLQLQTLATPVKHEALYSLLVRTLVATYGADRQAALPRYLPNGFVPISTP
ncbi:MAG: sulfatase-like hydrolase/transferase [Caldilineaceae bacterium]|nr:sulfatase-like hydrolase/transferase [Caldilineaceae bacterium]